MDGVYLTNIATLDTEDFEQLFDYLYQFQSLDRFKATFTPAIYSLPQEDICDRVSIKKGLPFHLLTTSHFSLYVLWKTKMHSKRSFEKEITDSH